MRDKLEKCFDFYRSQVNCIYGNTTNSGVIDTIRVPYQGQPTPIKFLAYTHDRDRVIVIRPFEADALGPILQAVKKAELSAYQTKLEVIVSIPSPTTETIERNNRRIRELAEEGKVAMRKVRQDFRAQLKALPEDDRKKTEKEVQKSLDEFIDRVENDSTSRMTKLQ